MQGEITSPFKGWKNLIYANSTDESKFLFRKKSRVDWSQGTLAAIRCTIFISSLFLKNITIDIYWNMTSLAVLWGYDTVSLKLREKRRLMVFDNLVLSCICESKREAVWGEWRKLHEELNYLYCSPFFCQIKSRILQWAVHVAYMRERKVAYRILVGKPVD